MLKIGFRASVCFQPVAGIDSPGRKNWISLLAVNVLFSAPLPSLPWAEQGMLSMLSRKGMGEKVCMQIYPQTYLLLEKLTAVLWLSNCSLSAGKGNGEKPNCP